MDNALLPEESNENRSARISVLTWHPKEGEALNLFTHIRPPTYGFTEHLAVDSHGLPVRMALTAGTPAYCTQAPFLTADVVAKYKLADRGYDRDAIVAQAEEQGMEADIPPRRNRQEPLDCDRGLYNLRHLLENALRTFRQWRGVATRYAKTEVSFSAICKKRAIVMGTKSS